MKRLTLPSLFALLVLTQSVVRLASAQDYQPWKFMHPRPQANGLSWVQMIDANTWVAAGDNGTFMKTTDGGANWYFHHAAGKPSNNALTLGGNTDGWFFDADNGFVVGAHGYVGKTTNGGVTFDSVANGLVPFSQTCKRISCVDRNIGYVAAANPTGFSGTIIKTTNGGTAWTSVFSSTVSSVQALCALDAQTVCAVLADGSTIKTTNGGTSWTTPTPGTVGIFMYGMSFVNKSTGFVSGSSGAISMTTDAGDTWSPVTTPQTDWAFYRIKAVSPTEIYAVGAADFLYKSTNLGTTWTALPIIPVAGPSDTFDWYSLDKQGSTLILSGAFGIIAKSTNGGTAWTSNSFLLTTQIMFDIQFVPGTNNVVAVGRQWSPGTKSVMYSSDAGKNWTTINIAIGTDLNALSMVNSQVGYACGTNSQVIKTTNGGLNWVPVTPPSSTLYTLYSMEFVDVNTGWVFVNYNVPSGGGIFKTTNGGTSWTQQGSNIPSPIMSADMVDANTGYLTLNPSGNPIYKTTNGGDAWTPVTTPLVGQIYDVCAVDANTVYIGSTFGTSRVAKSTNGGTTWTPITLPATIDVHSVDFRDANNGYVCGNSTTAVCKTTDGGTTWSIQPTHLPTLGKVYAGRNDTAFVLGTYASILRSVPTGPTSVEGQSEEWTPTTFALEQNYPNPFNPTTTLRYVLSSDSHVSLTVYNMLGARIATLHSNEMQSAGAHDVVWNGRNDLGTAVASGVYLYRINAQPLDGGPAFTNLKKMVLLK